MAQSLEDMLEGTGDAGGHAACVILARATVPIVAGRQWRRRL
jgi:hypothetical protein